MEKLDFMIGLILGVFGVLAYIKGFFTWLWKLIKTTSENDETQQIKIPKKSLTLVTMQTGHECWWHMGRMSNEPAMQIVAHFRATNICNLNILPTSAKMKKPKYLGHVMTKNIDENIYGSYMIPSRHISEVSVDFWISPPIKKEGEAFTSDIAVIDQFGNEHWIKNVVFNYR